MLKGIDISSYQKGLSLVYPSKPDFAIVKATEGMGLVDSQCDRFVQTCIANDILWGFYHFARKNDPVKEAEYFYRNTKNYFNHGIPVLDFEDARLTTDWGEKWLNRVHELSGVWPIVYMSSNFINNLGYFKNSWVKQKCGLWIAGYPRNYADYNVTEHVPYKAAGWTVALWQFTSSLRFNGYSVDGDFAYMDKEGWLKYAGAVQDGQNAEQEKPKEPAQYGEKHVMEDGRYRVTIEEVKNG